MMKFWSAALAAAVVVALPAAAMARSDTQAKSARIHAAPHGATWQARHHAARHHATRRHAAKASRVHEPRRSATRRAHHRHATRTDRFRRGTPTMRAQQRASARAHRAYAYAPAVPPGQWSTPAVQARPAARPMGAPRRHAARVGGLVAPLAQKAAQISAACGARVVSAVRHTRVAGSRTMSLHASGQAVDMQGNPGCIYRMLRGWAGGYSTDYGRVRHVHISWGGREQGLRFAHGGGRNRHVHGGGRSRWAARRTHPGRG